MDDIFVCVGAVQSLDVFWDAVRIPVICNDILLVCHVGVIVCAICVERAVRDAWSGIMYMSCGLIGRGVFRGGVWVCVLNLCTLLP